MIQTIEQLRGLYAPAKERAVKKQLSALDVHCQRFIELSPFVVISSVGLDQMLDASPRGGAPGFVKIVNAHTLLIPDSPGNNRLDTLENIIHTGKVGLLFLIPGMVFMMDSTSSSFNPGENFALSSSRSDCKSGGKSHTLLGIPSTVTPLYGSILATAKFLPLTVIYVGQYGETSDTSVDKVVDSQIKGVQEWITKLRPSLWLCGVCVAR